ncbi:MAG TPA: TraC family protein, partial [Candidatus Obscuribacterales bacterium]
MTGTKPRGNNRWSNLPASPAGSGSSSYSRGRGGDDIQPQSRQSPEAPQSIFGSIFGSLPPVLRDLLPFGPGATPDPDGKPPAAAPDAPSWQDVCFIHAIPGEDSDEGIVVLADGSLRKYIGCKGINALLFDEAEREQLARQFAALANSCDSDIQIIVMSRNLSVDEYLSRYQMLLKTDNEYLRWYADYTDKWFRRVQEVHFVPQRDFYVVVSFTPPDVQNQMQPWHGRRSIHKHEEYVETLSRLTKTAIEQLRGSNLRPAILTKKEVRNLIYSHLNPTLSETDFDAPRRRPDQSEASSLARSALKIHDQYLWLDGKYVGTQYMAETPHETWMGWLVDLLTLSVEYSVSMFVHTCNQDEVRKKLGREYRFGMVASTQMATPDLEGLEATRSAAAAIQEFLRSSNKAFDISMYIKTHGDTPEKLNHNMDEIRRVFKNRGAVMDRAQMMQFDGWQSTLPVGVDKLALIHRVMSPIVGTFWPFFTASCGTPDGVPFGFAIASREPVLLNPFFRGAGKDANNMFVVGATGAGKSFAVSMLILRLLPLGTRFVLMDKTVDRMGAYRFITELLGPDFCAYVDLGPNSEFMLNPFDLGPEDKLGDPSPDKLSTLLALLDVMLAPEGREELNVEEKSLLDGLIRVAYMEAGFRNTVPTMSDLARVTAQAAQDEIDPNQRERLYTFARGLSLFTRNGAFGGLVDGYTNIDAEKQFIVFDTRDVNDPRLERMSAFILAEFVRRKAAEA